MKKHNLISVIIPVYNAEKYLKECLDSIVNQTYKNIEIIVVNDGSKDNSREICELYANKYKNIKLINKENGGVSTARNEGIKKAEGKYILFVDSDDYIDSNMIEILYDSIMTENSELSICNVYGNKDFKEIAPILDRESALDLILDKDKYRGYPVNKLYKSEIVKEILFDMNIRICEDLLFNCEYISRINKISIVDKYLYHYNRNDNSAITNKKNLNKKTALDAYEKMISIYEKYASKSISKLYVSIVKTYTDILYNYHNAKIEFADKEKKEFVNRVYKKLMNKKNISKKLKMEIFLYYRFPILVQKMRSVYYKINKNKR